MKIIHRIKLKNKTVVLARMDADNWVVANEKIVEDQESKKAGDTYLVGKSYFSIKELDYAIQDMADRASIDKAKDLAGYIQLYRSTVDDIKAITGVVRPYKASKG